MDPASQTVDRENVAPVAPVVHAAPARWTRVRPRRTHLPRLVVVQVALAVTLLAGAGLLLRSFQELGRVSPGFDPRKVLTFHITASYGETSDWKGLQQ